jgi:putative DNA primase/helicase
MVTAVETDEGRRWDEAKIKYLTGGDKLKARFMRKDLFEFEPQFTPFVHGNKKPRLRSVDEAMRRRLHLVPFEVTIPERERDKKLGEKLKREWPGVLAWMIVGCTEWQRIGLSPPAKVTNATEAYFGSQDTMSQWIEECCTLDKNQKTKRVVLWACWQDWARNAGEYVGNSRDFYEALEKRGLEQTKFAGERQFKGIIAVKAPPADANATM